MLQRAAYRVRAGAATHISPQKWPLSGGGGANLKKAKIRTQKLVA